MTPMRNVLPDKPGEHFPVLTVSCLEYTLPKDLCYLSECAWYGYSLLIAPCRDVDSLSF